MGHAAKTYEHMLQISVSITPLSHLAERHINRIKSLVESL